MASGTAPEPLQALRQLCGLRRETQLIAWPSRCASPQSRATVAFIATFLAANRPAKRSIRFGLDSSATPNRLRFRQPSPVARFRPAGVRARISSFTALCMYKAPSCRFNPPWCDRIDLNVARGALNGHGLGQLDNGSFRRAVRGDEARSKVECARCGISRRTKAHHSVTATGNSDHATATAAVQQSALRTAVKAIPTACNPRRAAVPSRQRRRLNKCPGYAPKSSAATSP